MDNDNPAGATAAPGREDVMLEDIGRGLKAQEDEAKRKADEAEAARKAAAEAKARADATAALPVDPKVTALQEALRISEEARKRTEETLRSIGTATQTKKEEKELTEEELNELYQKNPLQAISIMTAKAVKLSEENISRRLEPLIHGGATNAKILAQSKYPDEFALFPSEIAQLEEKYSGGMSNPGAYDDLIAFIRGRPGNFEKLVEHITKKADEKKAEEARQREQSGAGSHTRSDLRPPPPANEDYKLDDTEKEIARTILSDLEPEDAYKEYAKYRGVGRR